MNTIRIKKLSSNFSDNYYIELIENQKVNEIYYVEKPKNIFDIILQNIKDFKVIELKFFLNENKRSSNIVNHTISLYIKNGYITHFKDFTSAIDYNYLEKIIEKSFSNLKMFDRVSIKF